MRGRRTKPSLFCVTTVLQIWNIGLPIFQSIFGNNSCSHGIFLFQIIELQRNHFVSDQWPYSGMSVSTKECSRVLQSAPECSRVLQSSPECSGCPLGKLDWSRKYKWLNCREIILHQEFSAYRSRYGEPTGVANAIMVYIQKSIKLLWNVICKRASVGKFLSQKRKKRKGP